MTTLNDLADGLQARLATISSLHSYSEPVERPHEPSAEVIDLGRRRDDASGGQVATFGIEISVSADNRGWSEAVRALRPYMDPTGGASVEAAIYAEHTLGGIADWSAVSQVGGIRRVEWGDGFRWSGRVIVEVCYDP